MSIQEKTRPGDSQALFSILQRWHDGPQFSKDVMIREGKKSAEFCARAVNEHPSKLGELECKFYFTPSLLLTGLVTVSET